jgi:hypothetical protein
LDLLLLSRLVFLSRLEKVSDMAFLNFL